MRTVIVSEHPGMAAWAKENGLAPESAVWLPKVTDPGQIVEARVIGDIPLALAALANHVISVVVSAPPGKKLQAHEFGEHVVGYTTVTVFQLSEGNPYRTKTKVN